VREGRFSSRTTGTPENPVSVVFRVDISGIDNAETITIGSENLIGSSWTETRLNREGNSTVYSGTFSIQPNSSVSYKYIYEVSGAGKTYEYMFSGSRKHLFIAFPIIIRDQSSLASNPNGSLKITGLLWTYV